MAYVRGMYSVNDVYAMNPTYLTELGLSVPIGTVVINPNKIISAPGAPNPYKKPGIQGGADRDKDIRKIIKMLDSIESLLEFFMKNYDWLAPDALEFKKKFQTSWKEIKVTFSNVDKLLLANLSKPSKDELRFRSNVFVKLNFDLFEMHGLTDAQLDLKYSILKELERRIRKYIPSIDDVKKYIPSKENVKKYILKHLGNFFDYANRFLESLSSVLPPLGAVKEFKDAVEAAIDFSEANPEDK